MKTSLAKAMLCASLILSITSCKKDSSKVDQNQIYQMYELTYDVNTDMTTITATFRKEDASGKLLELSSGSSVTFDGTKPKDDGANYEATYTGKKSSVAIVFTDTEGKTYANTINLNTSVSMSSKYYVDKTKNMSWSFYGGALESNETLYLSLENKDDNTKYANINTTTKGATSITVTASDMTNLPEGNTKVSVKKQKTVTTGDFAAAGGKLVSSYKGYEDFIYIY